MRKMFPFDEHHGLFDDILIAKSTMNQICEALMRRQAENIAFKFYLFLDEVGYRI